MVEWHSHWSQKRTILNHIITRLTCVRCWAASSTETEKSQAYWTCPSSSHTHMHMHTASEGFRRSLSHISAKNGWIHSYSDGEVMTMAHYPRYLPEQWVEYIQCLYVLLLLNELARTIYPFRWEAFAALATILCRAARKHIVIFPWISTGRVWKQNWVTSGFHWTFFALNFLTILPVWQSQMLNIILGRTLIYLDIYIYVYTRLCTYVQCHSSTSSLTSFLSKTKQNKQINEYLNTQSTKIL